MTENTLDIGRTLEEGITAQRAGRFDEAEKAYQAILAVLPDNFHARYMLGLLFLQRNHFDRAEQTISAALILQPKDASVHANRALALFHLGRFVEAVQACDRAVALNPALVAGHANRGKALLALRRMQEAIFSFDLALQLNPHYVDIWHARGNAFLTLGMSDKALASFDRAIAIKPDHAEALFSRGYALESLKRYDEAFLTYDRATILRPDALFLEGARLHARMHNCDWRDFDLDCARLLAHIDEGKPAGAPFVLLPIAASGQQQKRSAEKFVELRCPPAPQPLWRGERYAHDKIRIAYLSASLIQHPVGTLTVGLFERHDRARFETYALAVGPNDGSDTRKRLEKAFDHFLDMQRQSDDEIAAFIRSKEIDIVIDLDGFTTNGRTEILALRPAPIQASYLGYPSTIGASYIDYVIADPVVIPEAAEPDFVEKIARLPDCYLPNTERNALGPKPSRAACGLPENGIVFCCFNNTFKFTPDIFAVWMRLLRATPGSVLWMRDGSAQLRANLLRAAQDHGVPADRFVFAARTASHDDHFNRHQQADIFLDTLYYNAHTTAADALWTGVPVVTCLGSTFASRVGASLLGAVGLPELITHSLADYEALALKLAQDANLLASFKNRLQQVRSRAPLFDIARTTRHLEQAYQTMWQRSQKGEAPASFNVTPESPYSSSLP